MPMWGRNPPRFKSQLHMWQLSCAIYLYFVSMKITMEFPKGLQAIRYVCNGKGFSFICYSTYPTV